ncbi:MAG: glycosyltransferase [candidate division WOR-3 bacterium]|nr:glycosyltransferase [candidate division WOR-3 bacterium]
MKRLLFISYYWPPCGGPGSIRSVKFAKYLPQHGIEPVILTRKNIAYHSIDPELDADLKNIKVYRTESFDPARILYLCGMRIYRPKNWQIPIKKGLNFPDNKIGWIPFAYSAGLKIKSDGIFVTAPPFSSFITGYMIAKSISKPLILDFRDAWLEFPFLRYEFKIQQRFVKYWEKKIVQYARLIITVSESIKQSLLMRYPDIEDKVFVIPNGYDPGDFCASQVPKKFTISYLGTVRKERNPEPFLIAVQKFAEEYNLKSEDIEVKFVGHVEDEYIRIIKKYIFTKITGHLPYHQALKEFCSAHIALMITTGDEFFFPSRQNEYLASGLPIISCGKSRGLFILNQAVNAGYPVKFFDYGDVDGMKEEIRNFYAEFKANKLDKNPHPNPEYTRQNLTAKLAGLLKMIDKG